MPPIYDLKIGTDVVQVFRLKKAYARFGLRFLQRLLTDAELAYCQTNDPVIFLKRASGRVAVKEAVSKALGVGIKGLGGRNGVHWKNIEVISEPRQQPALALHHEARQLAAQQYIDQWRISLSHDGDVAMATAIGLVMEESV